MTEPARGEQQVRADIVAIARKMSMSGLSPGRSGNVSVRCGEGMLITPSALAYDVMTPDDIVVVNSDGSVPDPTQKPSTEWHFHLAAFAARPDCAAIVHTHSLHATVLACAGKNIPAFHYMVAVAGGKDIPLVPYALFGTEALAGHVANGLTGRDACLLANHGQIAIGANLAEAYELAVNVEILATQYVNVLQLGSPQILSDAAMDDVLEQFADYGRPPTASAD